MEHIILQNNHVSYYEVLGVNKDCTKQDVKLAYHKLLLTHHPDKKQQSQTENKTINKTYTIQTIQTAYKTISNDILRNNYDEALHNYYIKLGLVDGIGSRSNGVNVEGIDKIDLSAFKVIDDTIDNQAPKFVHSCPRCTFENGFVITDEDLEQGMQDHEHDNYYTHDHESNYQLLIQCASCSLWLCVMYSVSEE
jgi:diphthamide biosynthesis protein 4